MHPSAESVSNMRHDNTRGLPPKTLSFKSFNAFLKASEIFSVKGDAYACRVSSCNATFPNLPKNKGIAEGQSTSYNRGISSLPRHQVPKFHPAKQLFPSPFSLYGKHSTNPPCNCKDQTSPPRCKQAGNSHRSWGLPCQSPNQAHLTSNTRLPVSCLQAVEVRRTQSRRSNKIGEVVNTSPLSIARIAHNG